MNTVKILEASEVKLEDYKSLRLEALYEEPQAFGSSYKDQVDKPLSEWQNWLDNYIKGNGSWMVFAANDEKLLGMVGAFQENKDVAKQNAQIIAMYLRKEARGKGISKLLMQKLLDKLKSETQIKEVWLDVNVQQVAAVNLYKNFGFTVEKEENLVLGDGKEYLVYLMRKLL